MKYKLVDFIKLGLSIKAWIFTYFQKYKLVFFKCSVKALLTSIVTLAMGYDGLFIKILFNGLIQKCDRS